MGIVQTFFTFITYSGSYAACMDKDNIACLGALYSKDRDIERLLNLSN